MTDRPHGGPRYRADIEGLRAIAVGLVLIYHAGVRDLSGGFVGVDVFFVISGFLITSLLLAEFDERGCVSLRNFYARRAKRLLPAACIVLGVTALASWIVLPEYRWEVTGKDILSSAFYVVNWSLADRSVDYLAEDVPPSAVQHYWSLSVEEQFYIVWPLLMVAVALLARRYGHGRRLLTGGLVAVAAASFWYSLTETDHNPARAFFVTPTRMWELAVGALLAVGVAWLPRIPRRIAVTLGWGGLAAIVLAGFVVDATTPWPGWRAALPVLGAAAVIAAGPAAGRAGPTALLGTRPMRWIGGLSYSLYLWHWPLLVLAEEHYDGLSTTQGLLVVAASTVPAWVTHTLVENPVRHSRLLSARPTIALGVGANVTVGAAAGGLVLAMLASAAPAGVTNAPGAAVLASEPGRAATAAMLTRITSVTPDPLHATEDLPDLYGEGCQLDEATTQVRSCRYGSPDAPTTIAVVGDSKMAQWVPALQELAPVHGWRIVTYTKSSCAFADVETLLRNKRYTSCHEWVRSVIGRLTGPEKPDLVLTTQLNSAAAGSTPAQQAAAMRAGLISAWAQLRAVGVPVVVLADNPFPPRELSVWQCVADEQPDVTRCQFNRDQGIAQSGAPVQRQAVLEAGGRIQTADGRIPASTDPLATVYIDLVDWICPAAQCWPVIGGVLVYRQTAHLTATYVRSLAPALEQALRAAGVPTVSSAGAASGTNLRATAERSQPARPPGLVAG